MQTRNKNVAVVSHLVSHPTITITLAATKTNHRESLGEYRHGQNGVFHGPGDRTICLKWPIDPKASVSECRLYVTDQECWGERVLPADDPANKHWIRSAPMSAWGNGMYWEEFARGAWEKSKTLKAVPTWMTSTIKWDDVANLLKMIWAK